jgi:hypothetical protein
MIVHSSVEELAGISILGLLDAEDESTTIF